MAFNACEADIFAAEKVTEALPPLPHGGSFEGQGFRGVGEPALTDMLKDPTMGSMLASDGVQQDRLLELIESVRTKLA